MHYIALVLCQLLWLSALNKYDFTLNNCYFLMLISLIFIIVLFFYDIYDKFITRHLAKGGK